MTFRTATVRTVLTAGLACTLLPHAASARDARLVQRSFNPDEVVRIDGRVDVQASIAFAEDEHIENVAVGDSNAWQITPNKRANLLFVKPLAARTHTNMTVVTDRRTYFFDLVSAPAANPLYVLRFTYPDEPKASARPAAVHGAMNELETQAAAGVLAEKPAEPPVLNFAWAQRGSSKVMPAKVYDDGQATFLSWAAGKQIPAILVRDEKGAEGPVNFAVRSDVIVIDGVPGLIVLRSGRDTATLENEGVPRQAGAVPVIPTTPAAAEARNLASAAPQGGN